MTESKSSSGPVGQAHRLIDDLFTAARNLTYASVGIVGAVGEEAEEVYRRSIKRGQRRVRKLEQRLPIPARLKRGPDGTEDVDADVASEAGKLSEAASAEWQAVLDRLHLANPQDVETLTNKLADLEAKLDALEKQA